MASLNLDHVRHALSAARQKGFAEVELALGDDQFVARLAPTPPGVAKSGESVIADEIKPITATLVGYYRSAPKPLEVGSIIKSGDLVAVLTALGIQNEVFSKLAGEVVEVCVHEGQAVEFGQVLAKVKVI